MSFVTNVFSCSKYCPTLLETVGLRMSKRNFRDFSLLMLTLKAETALQLDVLRRQMLSAVILIYSMDIHSRLTIC